MRINAVMDASGHAEDDYNFFGVESLAKQCHKSIFGRLMATNT